MIAVKLEGRLGNQLFQYALIYAAAKKLKTPFYLDQEFQNSLVHKYFQVDVNAIDVANALLFNTSGFKNLFNIHLRKNLNRLITNAYKLNIKTYKYPEEESSVDLENQTLYIGYFQSLLYIKSYESLLRKKLTIKKIFSEAFDQQFGKLYQNKTIVTIHIRRTDYKNLGHLNLGNDDLSLPLSYYRKCLSQLSHKNLHYIFISDDINFVEKNFNDLQPKTISTRSEIYDFQHMMHSDICIISNSTFSWWSAWLNNKKNKIVYCPKYYLGFRIKKQVPLNIYPKEWRQIAFN